MNLGKKKELAKRTLKVGKGEIKEAITKQDIRDLKREGAIVIKNIKGRRKVKKKKKKGVGNIRKKIKTRMIIPEFKFQPSNAPAVGSRIEPAAFFITETLSQRKAISRETTITIKIPLKLPCLPSVSISEKRDFSI